MRSLWFLSVLILACMTNQMAWGKSFIVDDGDFSYFCDDVSLTAEMTAYRGSESFVTVPPFMTYKGNRYTVISVVAEDDDCGGFTAAAATLEGVVLPSSIKEIGWCSFYGCSKLKSVTGLGSVTEIGHAAFYGCEALVDLDLNFKNLSKIESSAFRGCRSLTMDIETSDKLSELGAWAFAGCVGIRKMRIAGSKNLSWGVRYAYHDPGADGNVLNGCSGLEELEICDGVRPQSTYDHPFGVCENLKKVTVGSGMAETIRCDGFPALERYETTAALESVRRDCFSDCPNLEVFSAPNAKIAYINESAFKGCSKLRQLDIDFWNVLRIDSEAFKGCALIPFGMVKLPCLQSDLGSAAFSGCEGLTGVWILNDYTSLIQSETFRDCKNLSEVSLRRPCTKIGSYAFSGCESLKEFTVSAECTEIGYMAFAGCKSLMSVEFKGAPLVGRGSVGNAIFDGLDAAARGYYPSEFESEWGKAVDGEGKWHGLKMMDVMYKKPPVEIAFVSNFDTDKTVSMQFPCDRDFALPSDLFTREKHYLKGWSRNRNGNPLYYADQTMSFAGETEVTLYAIWEKKTPMRVLMKVSPYAWAGLDGYVGTASYCQWSVVRTGESTKVERPDDNGLVYLDPRCPSYTVNFSSVSSAWAAILKSPSPVSFDLDDLKETDGVRELWVAPGGNAQGFHLTISGSSGVVLDPAKAKFTIMDLGTYKTIELTPDTYYLSEGMYQIVAARYEGGDWEWKKTSIIIDTHEYVESDFIPTIEIVYSRIESMNGADNFAEAKQIAGMSGSVTGSNLGATAETGEPLVRYKSGATATIWWKWTAPADGRVKFDTIGSSLASETSTDTVLGVYVGPTLASLSTIKEDDDGAGSGNASKCEFDCTAGIEYYVVAAGYGGKTGTIKLNWNLVPSGVPSDFEIADGVLVKYKGTGGAVAIPLGVIRIGSWSFQECTGLTSMTIPSSVKEIDAYAFYGCSGLTSVTISSGVTSIGVGAFCGCSGLPSLWIPSSVTSIGIGAFQSCTSLTRFTVDGVNAAYKSVNGLLLSKDGKQLIGGINGAVTIPSGVTSICNSSFSGLTGLMSIAIPSGVREIEDNAFYWCSGLASVSIPASVTHIGKGAFYCCEKLPDVTVPSAVTSIGESAFHGCRGLTQVTIPSSVTSIGLSAFGACSGLMRFVVDAENPAYKSENGLLLSKDGRQLICGINGDVVIPDGVTSIGERAFWGYNGLMSVSIPSSVTSIGEWAFYPCEKLSTVYVDAGDAARVRDLMTRSKLFNEQRLGFSECPSAYILTYKPGSYGSGFQQTATKTQGVALMLKGPIFTRSGYAQTGWTTSDGGAKVYDLGDICNVDTSQTLYPCWSLPNSASDFTYEIYNDEARIRGYVGSRKDVVVPSSLGGYSVASVLFENCKEISSVTMPSSVQKVSSYDFNYCYGLRAVVLGQGVTEVDRGAFFRCTNLVYLSLSADVTNIKCGSFVDCPNLIQIDVDPGNKSFRSNGPIVSSKDGKTLVWYPSATGEVRVSPEVTEIGDGAFAGTRDLKSVMIPSGVTRIGNRAFRGCTSLMPPQLPTSLRTIGDETFYCCYGLQSLEIPAGVESIGEMAFYNCYKLESLRIAASVTNIDYLAFQDCKKLGDGLVIVDGCLLTVNGDCPSSVIIPSGVRLVAGGSFYRRSTLKSATIPSSVKILCRGVFDLCENLSAVTLNEGLEEISDDCFNFCSCLKSAAIPSSVIHIGRQVFNYCMKLETVELKEGLETIGQSAFFGCRCLQAIAIPASVKSIGDSAFGGLSPFECMFAGPPPEVGMRTFDATARGVYTVAYASQWQSVIVDKCWNCLAMRCQGEEWVDFPTSIAIMCASTELESGSQSVCACAAMMQSQSWETKRVEPEWSVDVGGDVISVLPGGLLNVGYVTEPRQVVIRATYTEGGVTKTATATLTVLPKSVTFMVKFAANGGTGTMDSLVCMSGTVYNLANCVFTPPAGKRFAGWRCSNGRRYDDGMLVFDLAQPGETVTMTAIWE